MGCDRSIAFVTRIFSQTSADPLVWHTDGLVPGNYDWKCWMDDCYFGKLVVDDAADVAVDSGSPHDVVTNVAASTPFRLRLHGAGARDDVLADHPLHDGGQRPHQDHVVHPDGPAR